MQHVRSTIILIIFSLLLGAIVQPGQPLQAAPEPAPAPLQGAFLPVITTGAPAADVATVLECSCGYADAIVAPNGTIYVMVQDYARGGKLFVYIDDGGDTLREALAPPMEGLPPAGDPAPSFSFPAQKNGPGAMVITAGPNATLNIYAPARPLGVTEGRYNLMRSRAPLASITAQGP